MTRGYLWIDLRREVCDMFAALLPRNLIPLRKQEMSGREMWSRRALDFEAEAFDRQWGPLMSRHRAHLWDVRRGRVKPAGTCSKGGCREVAVTRLCERHRRAACEAAARHHARVGL